MFVCVLATLMLNISETKQFMGSCPVGTLQEVPMARLLIQLRTLREAFGMTTLWPKFSICHEVSNLLPPTLQHAM